MSDAFERAARAGLEEDLGEGGLDADVTTRATVPASLFGEAVVVAKADGVVCGLEALDATFQILDPTVTVSREREDGDEVAAGDVAARVTGSVSALLTGERTALNILTHLSGVATLARAYQRAAGRVEVSDIRKTLPGLRALEKYAVRTGGAHNHRFSLRDAVLVKDNHVVAAGGVAEAVRRARSSGMTVEVECDGLGQVGEALDAGADAVLLDNFTPAQLREAVAAIRDVRPGVLVEASGGVTLALVPEIAATGVDRISVGALTHSAPALDFGFDLVRTWERPDAARH